MRNPRSFTKIAIDDMDSSITKVKRIRKSKLSPLLNKVQKIEKKSEITADTNAPKKSRKSKKFQSKQQKKRFQPVNINSLSFSQMLHKALIVLVEKTSVSEMTINQTLILLRRFYLRVNGSIVNLDLAVFSCFLIVTKFYEYWGKVRIQDIINYCGGIFSKDHIIQMQAYILYVLNYDIVEQDISKSNI